MTDRELLERAAKKLRIPIVCWNDGSEPYSSGEGFILEDNSLWNPLRIYGQAFSLMVQRGLKVEAPKYKGFGSTAGNVTVFRDDLSPELQTCRAIVMAVGGADT